MSDVFDKGRVGRRQLGRRRDTQASKAHRYLDLRLDLDDRLHGEQVRLALDGPGLVLLARGDDGGEEAAVMGGGAEPVERCEMLRHAALAEFQPYQVEVKAGAVRG